MKALAIRLTLGIIVIVLLMLFLNLMPFQKREPITIMINNKLLQTDMEPYMEKGEFHAPARAVAEALTGKHAHVLFWSSEEKAGEDEDSYAPLREIIASFDADLTWDAGTRTVSISTR